MRYLIIILIFIVSCGTIERKAGIYGLSNIQKKHKKGFIEYTFDIHFTKDTDRFSIYYYRIVKGQWKQADVEHHNFPGYLKKKAERSVGVPAGFTTTHDVRVKMEVIAYYPVSQFNAVTKEFTHVFE